MAKRRGKLTDQQATFVREYLVDLNATQAALRAGYSQANAAKVGSRLLGLPHVSAAVQAGMDKRAAKVEVRAEEILRELMRIGYADIGQAFDERGQLKALRDIPEDVRRAIASYESNLSADGVSHKVKFWDKPKALEALGRHLKLFTDQIEHSGSVVIVEIPELGDDS